MQKMGGWHQNRNRHPGVRSLRFSAVALSPTWLQSLASAEIQDR